MNAIKSLNPHLFFQGEAAEAISFYQRALGAEVLGMTHAGEIPGADLSPERKKLVAHAMLRIGGGMLMISDVLMQKEPSGGAHVPPGNGAVHLEFADVSSLNRAFDAMAPGGRVTCAVHDAFWGATYGVLVDKYGVGWNFHCDAKTANKT
jgi:PhnB protein